MASFWFLLILLNLLLFMNSSFLTLASDHQLNSETPLSSSFISASPALLTNPPTPTQSESTIPPYQPLSPDISPLLPSPGGVVPAPTRSSNSIPTIPSNPSPPNPDELLAPGPDSAFSPFGSFPAPSSMAPTNLLGLFKLPVYVVAIHNLLRI